MIDLKAYKIIILGLFAIVTAGILFTIAEKTSQKAEEDLMKYVKSTKTSHHDAGLFPAAANQSLGIVSRVLTVSPTRKDSATREQFDQMVSAAQNNFPTKADLKNLSPEDVHNQLPPPLMDAAQRLASLVQFSSSHPEVEDQALHFFGSCVNRSEWANVIRARCLSNYRRLAQRRGFDVSLDRYPKEIVNLVEFLN